jgi:hypothetical protein
MGPVEGGAVARTTALASGLALVSLVAGSQLAMGAPGAVIAVAVVFVIVSVAAIWRGLGLV